MEREIRENQIPIPYEYTWQVVHLIGMDPGPASQRMGFKMGLFDLLNKKNASVLTFIEEGTRFHESGQFAFAVDSFEKALSQDPGRYDAWVGRGSALFYLDRYSDALTSFEKAIEIDPRRPDAWKYRGRTLHELGRSSEALESYEKAIDCDPGDADTLYYRGLALHELGRLADAIEAYEQILKTDQNNPDIWFRHGVALDDLGQYVRSIESYYRALAIDPSNAVGWYNRGVALERLSRLPDAVESYQRALEIAPNHPGAQRNLPRLIEEMQRGSTGVSDDAISPLSDGSSLVDTESESNLPDFGSDTEETFQETNHELIDDPDEWIGSPDDSAPDELPVPDALPVRDELPEPDALPVPDPADPALEVKADMISPIEEPEKVDWAKSAMKYASEGSFEEALMAYDQALREDPGDMYLWVGRGLALENLEQYPEAVESFDMAIELDPDNAKVWYNRGLALEQLKRYDDAIDSYDRALAIDSHLSAVRKKRDSAISEKQKEEGWMVSDLAKNPLSENLPSLLRTKSPEPAIAPLSEEIPETEEPIAMATPQVDEESAEADRGDLDSVSDEDPSLEILSPSLLSIEEDEMPEVVSGDPEESVIDITTPDSASRGDEDASPPVAKTFEEDLDAADRALSRNPDDKNAWYNRGVALLHLERFSEAVDAYDHALKLDPGMPDAWNNRGVALAWLGRNEEAMESYNRALLLDPVHSSSWMNKARTLAELNRPADAVESYDRALAINPQDASAWYNRGVLLSEMGEAEESAQCLDKALAIGYKTGKEWYTSAPFKGYIDNYVEVSESDDGKTPESMPAESGEDGESDLEMDEEIDADLDSFTALPDISGDPDAIEVAMEASDSDLPSDTGSDVADVVFGSEAFETVPDDFGDVDLEIDLPAPDEGGEVVEDADADPDPFAALPDITGDPDAIRAAMETSDSDVHSDDGSDDADVVFGSKAPDTVSDDFGEVGLEDDLLSPDSAPLPPEISAPLSDSAGYEEAGGIGPHGLPEAPDVPDADDDVSDPDGVEGVYGHDMAPVSDTSAPSGDSEVVDEEPSPEDEMAGLETESSFAEILKYYDRAVVRSPDDADLWYNRGLVLYNLNRYREAVESFERAVAINPDYAEAERNRRILVALIQKKIVDYERKGTECATEGRFDEAVVYYDQVLSLDPEAPSVWYNRGVALRNLGRYEEAVASYDHALSLAPGDPGTWYNRGVALRNLGRYEDAIESYDRALALDPDDADTWHNRGVAFRKLGRNADAVSSFDQALSINSTDAAIWYNRGIALRQLGRYDNALESYDQMLALEPENILAHNNRGFLLNEIGRHEEAAESYNKSILLNPENAAPWVGRGIAEFNLGHYAAAVESLNRALGIDPEDSYSWQVHGLTHARLNQHAEAVLSYDRAIALDPADARIWVIRGLSLMEVGSYQEAVLSFDRVLELDPDNSDILSHRDEAARMIPVEERIQPVEETALRSVVEPGAIPAPESPVPESRRSRSPATSFSVTLDHSRFIRNQWHRVPLAIQNKGSDPLIDLLISFSEDFATRRLIPVTVPPGDQVTIDIGIKPLSVGMVPLDLRADYRDEEGNEYTRIFEFWIEVVPEH